MASPKCSTVGTLGRCNLHIFAARGFRAARGLLLRGAPPPGWRAPGLGRAGVVLVGGSPMVDPGANHHEHKDTKAQANA